jgi:hypothetical protein
MFIPYPGPKRFRVPDPYPHQRIPVFLTLKTVSKLNCQKNDLGCSSRIRTHLRSPIQGVKKNRIPDRIHNAGYFSLSKLCSTVDAYTVIRLLRVGSKYGTCTIVSVMGHCAQFSFNKCPIFTHDGASAKFGTNSHETANSVSVAIKYVFSWLEKDLYFCRSGPSSTAWWTCPVCRCCTAPPPPRPPPCSTPPPPLPASPFSKPVL